MYLLPGNPFSQAVEAYRDSGEALCSKGVQAVPRPFTCFTLMETCRCRFMVVACRSLEFRCVSLRARSATSGLSA